MTLSVDVMLERDDGSLQYVEVATRPPNNDLFGTQSTTAVWGALAATLRLPLLARVAGPLPTHFLQGELSALESEARALKEALPELVPATSVSYLDFRLGNLLEAIRLARDLPDQRGAVSIG